MTRSKDPRAAASKSGRFTAACRANFFAWSAPSRRQSWCTRWLVPCTKTLGLDPRPWTQVAARSTLCWAMVPVATKRPASLPSMAATLASKAFKPSPAP